MLFQKYLLTSTTVQILTGKYVCRARGREAVEKVEEQEEGGKEEVDEETERDDVRLLK